MDTLDTSVPSKRASRTELVYAALRDKIIRAVLLPGDVLVESDLAKGFQISKTPVREALQILVNDGLINVIPRKGYVVRQMGVRDVREVFEVRLALESSIAASAAKQATEKDIADLESLHEIQKSGQGTETLTNAARHFHLRILDAARNQRAKSILVPLFDETTRMHHLVPLTARYLRSEKETHDHDLILDALKNHDHVAAERSMREHIVAVRETTMRGLLDV